MYVCLSAAGFCHLSRRIFVDSRLPGRFRGPGG